MEKRIGGEIYHRRKRFQGGGSILKEEKHLKEKKHVEEEKALEAVYCAVWSEPDLLSRAFGSD